MASIIFCTGCGSDMIDVNHMNGANTVIRCSSCRMETELRGFTLGKMLDPEADQPALEKLLEPFVEAARRDRPQRKESERPQEIDDSEDDRDDSDG